MLDGDLSDDPRGLQEMELVDILWRQDVDLGAGREVFDRRLRQKEASRRRQRQQEEKELLEREAEKEEGRRRGLHLDEETGELTPGPLSLPSDGDADGDHGSAHKDPMLCEMEEETLSFAECMQLLEDSFPLDDNMQAPPPVVSPPPVLALPPPVVSPPVLPMPLPPPVVSPQVLPLPPLVVSPPVLPMPLPSPVTQNPMLSALLTPQTVSPKLSTHSLSPVPPPAPSCVPTPSPYHLPTPAPPALPVSPAPESQHPSALKPLQVQSPPSASQSPSGGAEAEQVWLELLSLPELHTLSMQVSQILEQSSLVGDKQTYSTLPIMLEEEHYSQYCHLNYPATATPLPSSPLPSHNIPYPSCSPVEDLAHPLLNNLCHTTLEDLSPPNLDGLSPPNLEDLSPHNLEDLSLPNLEELSPPNLEDLSTANMEDLSPTNLEDISPPNLEDISQTNLEDISPTNLEDLNPSNWEDLDLTEDFLCHTHGESPDSAAWIDTSSSGASNQEDGSWGFSESETEEVSTNPTPSQSQHGETTSRMLHQSYFSSSLSSSGPSSPDANPCPAIPGHAERITKDKIRKFSRSRGRGFMSRDEQRARALSIPFSVDNIINLPVDDFNELMTHHQLSESQLVLIRDIRRRGKNKVAAQNCRKRKMASISGLEEEMEELQRERGRLLGERAQRETSLKGLRVQLGSLYLEVFSKLRDEEGQPYSPSLYSLQQASDGSMFLVPRANKAPKGNTN